MKHLMSSSITGTLQPLLQIRLLVISEAFYNDESIFQGTDGGEYWTAAEFKGFQAALLKMDAKASRRHWYRKEIRYGLMNG